MSDKWPQATTKLIEDKANGPAVINTLKDKLPGIVAVTPRGSKESRLYAVQPLFEAGNVYFPDPSIHPWVRDLEEELACFPNAPNDDQADALSMALSRYASATKPITFDITRTGVRPNPWKM